MPGCCAPLLRLQGEGILKALSCLCSERVGSLLSCSRPAGIAMELKWTSILAILRRRSFQDQAMAPQPPGKPNKGQGFSIEWLWQKLMAYFLQWPDNISNKRNRRSPDCSHERSKELLRIVCGMNSPLMKAELAAVIEGRAHFVDGFNLDIHYGAPDRESIRMAGLNQAQFFLLNETDGTGSTSSITTPFEREPRQGVNKRSSIACGDVRTLCKAGRLREALHMLNCKCIHADSNTYLLLLQQCINMKGLAEGKQVHAHIIQSGFKPNSFLLNTLVNMYAKCGSLVDARQVFDKIPERDVFTWTIMITGYAKRGWGGEALKMYEQMRWEGVMPNMVTFLCVLNACASVGALDKGREVHADILKGGIASYINLENTLVDMYAKCGSIKDARQVLDNMAKRNVVSWSAMIAGYAQQGCGREAFEIYEQMQKEGVIANSITFVCVLQACASLGALQKGREIHSDIIKTAIVPDIILETALADMYAKCGSMKEARQVFDNMAERDAVAWNAMIAGYAQQECAREASEIYGQMQREGVTPNRVTFICILQACASLGALEQGKEVHAQISKAGIVLCINLETALVDMYAKCGSMIDAHQVFDNMPKRNVVSWSALITGYAQHGCGREALQLFEQMQQEGLHPNSVTYISILSVCSHVGLVEEGCHYFDSMIQGDGLTPTSEHFCCMVDLLGRSGRLKEAEDFILKMPVEADAGVWGALLGGCRLHGDLKLAERAANCLLKWETQALQLQCAAMKH